MPSYVFDPDRQRNVEPNAYPVAPDALNSSYVFDEDGDLAFAVNVAIVTGRPLLLRGPSGSGKSTLAEAVATILGWTFTRTEVTSATQWRDLCWRYDAVARLADAQIADLRSMAGNPKNYITPGALWKAFDLPPDASGVVVLIDEIDKAEPNVPNDLLVPLGLRRFTVDETGEVVSAHPPSVANPSAPFGPVLIVITDNEERDLPPAFLRRCVVHRIAPPSIDHLLKVAKARFGERVAGLSSTLTIASHFASAKEVAGDRASIRPASVAEFLDALSVVTLLGEAEALKCIDRILGLIAEDAGFGDGPS